VGEEGIMAIGCIIAHLTQIVIDSFLIGVIPGWSVAEAKQIKALNAKETLEGDDVLKGSDVSKDDGVSKGDDASEGDTAVGNKLSEKLQLETSFRSNPHIDASSGRPLPQKRVVTMV
jgi:hypothetical protein